MIWKLSDKWAVSRDPYNWILLKRTGRSWKKFYYASPEMLLKSLSRKISRSTPAQPDLATYLDSCLQIAQEFSKRFYDQTGITPSGSQETRPKTSVRCS